MYNIKCNLYLAPSGSPESFNGTATSPYSAYLVWELPPLDQQNGIIIGYVISMTIVETNEIVLLYSNTTFLVVNSFEPFRTYICVIAAQTTTGTGPFSIEIILSTPQDGNVFHLLMVLI